MVQIYPKPQDLLLVPLLLIKSHPSCTNTDSGSLFPATTQLHWCVPTVIKTCLPSLVMQHLRNLKEPVQIPTIVMVAIQEQSVAESDLKPSLSQVANNYHCIVELSLHSEVTNLRIQITYLAALFHLSQQFFLCVCVCVFSSICCGSCTCVFLPFCFTLALILATGCFLSHCGKTTTTTPPWKKKQK